MKAKKAIVALGCAALLVTGSVMGTMAYLTSETDQVTNTFSVGNVKITLDEAKVKIDGTVDGETRVTENTYHLLPNHSYTKDPTVHVDENSEPSWLFVKVTNDIAAIEADDETKKDTVAEQMEEKGWTLVSGQTNVYAYKEIVTAGKDYIVFENFKIAGSVTNDTLAAYKDRTITIDAYAIQADGFNDAAAAWDAAPATWTDVKAEDNDTGEDTV